MARGAVGEPAAHQHADGTGEQVAGERGIGRHQIGAIDRDKRDDGKRHETGTGGAGQQEEQEHHHHRHRPHQHKPPAQPGAFWGRGVRRRIFPAGVQMLALPRHDRRQHQPGDADQDQRRVPVVNCDQRQHRRRRGGPAEIAGEGVDTDGTAEEFAFDAGRKDGVIGGMEHAVAEPCDAEQGEQLPVRGAEPGRDQTYPHQGDACDQHPAPADAVDQESHGKLADPGGGANPATTVPSAA